MKQISLLFLLLIFSLSLFSQANKKHATLYFKNGDSLKCFARIAGENVRYAKTKKGKEIKINFSSLDHIQYRNYDKKINVYYVKEKGKEKPKLMELIADGKVQMYRVFDVYQKKSE